MAEVVVVSGAASYNVACTPFNQMQSQVASYVQLPDDPEALGDAGLAINNGIRSRINGRTWKKYLLATQTITLAADTSTYSLESNFKDPRSAYFLNSSSKRKGRCRYKHWRVFDLEHPYAEVSGNPAWYTVRDDTRKVELDVAPTATFVTVNPSLFLRYHSRMAVLRGSECMSGVPSEFENMILWYAKFEMAATYAPGKAQQAFSMWQRLEADLLRDDNDTETDFSEF